MRTLNIITSLSLLFCIGCESTVVGVDTIDTLSLECPEPGWRLRSIFDGFINGENGPTLSDTSSDGLYIQDNESYCACDIIALQSIIDRNQLDYTPLELPAVWNQGRIVELNLANLDIEHLSFEFALMDSLRSLDLQNNNLDWYDGTLLFRHDPMLYSMLTLPDGIQYINVEHMPSNLQSLWIGGNQLSFIIPSAPPENFPDEMPTDYGIHYPSGLEVLIDDSIPNVYGVWEQN